MIGMKYPQTRVTSRQCGRPHADVCPPNIGTSLTYTHDCAEVAEDFNKYFVSVGANAARKLRNWPTNLIYHLCNLKEGDHEVATNNRPMSLLPALSKVIELVAHEQFVYYLTTKGKLSVHQSGNKKLLCKVKSFDSINHGMLLENLKRTGVTASALNWFTSYLSKRQQCVRISNKLSSPLKMMHGVTQGSIIGLLLFNLFTNDLPSVSTTSKIQSCVDDSKL